MTEQFSLAGIPAAAPKNDRLFFGIFPEPSAVAEIARTAQHSCSEFGFRGRPLAADRFHVTLHHVDDYAGLPRGVVEDAKAAAASVVAAPFEVTFDRAASFARPRNLPFVLRGGEGLAALIAFQGLLFAALQRAGLVGSAAPNFTPHVTLLYDDRKIVEHPVAPVRWTVREFVLIHSLIGQTRHIPLARWPLRDEPR